MVKKVLHIFLIIAATYFFINAFAVPSYNRYNGVTFFNVYDLETIDSFLERHDLVRVSPVPKGGDIYLFVTLSRKYPEKRRDDEIVITITQKVFGIGTTLYGIYNVPCGLPKSIGTPM